MTKDERQALILIHKTMAEVAKRLPPDNQNDPYCRYGMDIDDRHSEIEKLLSEPFCHFCNSELTNCRCDTYYDEDDDQDLRDYYDATCRGCGRFNCNCNLYPYE